MYPEGEPDATSSRTHNLLKTNFNITFPFPY